MPAPIGELLGGLHVRMPPAYGTFKQASRVREGGEQLPLEM